MSDRAPEGPSGEARRGGGVPRRWILMVTGPLVILAALAWYLLSLGRFQTTDNAFVQVAKTPVAPSISGRVVEIFVRENQAVKKGQVLFRLDARDAQASLSAAEAQLASAEQMVAQQRAAYGREQANVAAARESLSYAEAEATRQAGLAAAGAGSVQVADQARHTARLAREQLKAAEQSAAAALLPLIRGERLGDACSIHVLDVKGPPLVHVTRSYRPEIVFFGTDHPVADGLRAEAGSTIVVVVEGRTARVSRFAAGAEDQSVEVDATADAIVRAVIETGGTYPDAVQFLQQAGRRPAPRQPPGLRRPAERLRRPARDPRGGHRLRGRRRPRRECRGWR